MMPAPATAAGFFISRDRTAARRRPYFSPRVAVRAFNTSSNIGRRARTRRRTRGDARPRPPCSPGIGFAPEMIARTSDHAALFFSEGNSMMTAYLISLAIMFLVAIALFDGMS